MKNIVNLDVSEDELLLYAINKREQGKYLVSLDYLDRALKKRIKNKETLELIYLEKAENYISMNLYENALSIYYSIYKNAYNIDSIYFGIINCLLNMKKFDSALLYLQMGIEKEIIEDCDLINFITIEKRSNLKLLDKNDDTDLFTLGQLMIFNNDTKEKGKEILKRIYPDSKQYEEANYNLALEAFTEKNYKTAKKYLNDLKKNISNSSLNTSVVLIENIINYKLDLINKDELMDTLRKINFGKNNVKNYLFILASLCCLNEHDVIEYWAEKSLSIFSYNKYVLLIAAQANYNCKHYDKALEKITKIISIDKLDYEAFVYFDLISKRKYKTFEYSFTLPTAETFKIKQNLIDMSINTAQTQKRILENNLDLIEWLFTHDNFLNYNENINLLKKIIDLMMQETKYKEFFENIICTSIYLKKNIKRYIIFQYIKYYEPKVITYSVNFYIKTIMPKYTKKLKRLNKVFQNVYFMIYVVHDQIKYFNDIKIKRILLNKKFEALVEHIKTNKIDISEIKNERVILALILFKLFNFLDDKKECCDYCFCSQEEFDKYFKILKLENFYY